MAVSSDPLLIGVDGGGTGCRAAVAQADLKILGLAEGGRAKVATNIDRAIANVVDTIDRAAQATGVGPDALAAATAHIGLAGVTTEAENPHRRRPALQLLHHHRRSTDHRHRRTGGRRRFRSGDQHRHDLRRQTRRRHPICR